MRRLLATMRCDIRLQARHGFYYATAFVLIVCVALISRTLRLTCPGCCLRLCSVTC